MSPVGWASDDPVCAALVLNLSTILSAANLLMTKIPFCYHILFLSYLESTMFLDELQNLDLFCYK